MASIQIGKASVGKRFILASLMVPCLLAGCSTIGLQERTEARGGKFSGTHAALANCILHGLESDSRWVIRALQYEVRTYPEIGMTEIYAYAPGVLPGTYARNSPENPDAVIARTPPVEVPSRKIIRDAHPGHSFILTLKRTDSTTVYANLNGKQYEGGVAWEKLTFCSR